MPTDTPLANSVLDIIAARQRKFVVAATGEIFEGITETELANELRDHRWKLPGGWLYDVEKAGFQVRQVHYFPGGEVRTHFDEAPTINPDTGRPFRYESFQRRKLSRYTTIISL